MPAGITLVAAAKLYGVDPADLRRRVRRAKILPTGTARVGKRARADVYPVKPVCALAAEVRDGAAAPLRPPPRKPAEPCDPGELLTAEDRREIERRRRLLAERSPGGAHPHSSPAPSNPPCFVGSDV